MSVTHNGHIQLRPWSGLHMPTTPSTWLCIHYTLQVEMPGDAPFNKNMGGQHSEGAMCIVNQRYIW